MHRKTLVIANLFDITRFEVGVADGDNAGNCGSMYVVLVVRG